MKRLLWVGDAACSSGFARATHAVCDHLATTGWDVSVLGLNYRGDPHDYPYPIYPAFIGGDVFGVGRIVWTCDKVKPDIIVIQQDPWNFPGYFQQLERAPEYQWIPVVGFVAVDGKNCLGGSLKNLSLAVFWSNFGAQQARIGGYTGPSAVVPLGVDIETFTSGDRQAARRRLGLPERMIDGFFVGNVNRNQPRKRLDLTIKYFAEWWRGLGKPRNVFLYLHVAPTGEFGYDLRQLARYYGINYQIVISEPEPWSGINTDTLVDTYRAFDVQVTTTQGEGDGLTTKEGMACGIPQIVPDWSALGEWTRGYALLVPCTSTAATIGHANAIGGVADEEQFIEALNYCYRHADVRANLGQQSFECARQEQFRWTSTAKGFERALRENFVDAEGRETDGRVLEQTREEVS